MTEVKQQQPYVRNVLKKHEDQILAQEASLGAMSMTLGEVEATLDAVNVGLTNVVQRVKEQERMTSDLCLETAAHESKLLDHERLLGGTSTTTQAQAAMLHLLLTLGFWAKVRWFLFNRLPETPVTRDRAVLYPRAKS
jgi:hypothetical protein